ncbi:MAG: ClbS/DfsB family four-helix bundle protein [Verrucomicrobia bacterium]|nr:ClbS/DfsB family four-helix bundle protein [Verrucomicrobiota bacterium]
MALTLKAPLSHAISKEYGSLISSLRQIPAEKRTIRTIEGTGGKVSVADLIAYQIGWGSLLIGWYEAGINGRVPEMPGEGFATWDYLGLAKHFYLKYAFDHFLQQEAAFQDIVERILEIVEREHLTGNLDKAGVWAWCTLPSGKLWPLSKWIRVNTASPYKKASLLIKKSQSLSW